MNLPKIIKITILFAGIVCIAGVIWVVQKQLQPGKFSGIKEAVRIGIARESLAALAIIAEDQKFFSQEGIDVTIKLYDSGKLAFTGVCDGEVDLATVADTPIVFSSFEREDFSIIATIGFSDNEPRIIARKDKGIQKPGDLRGRRIATQKGSSVHFFLHLFLIKNGLSEKDVVLSFKKPDELVTALVNGEIDAFSMREPFISKTKKLIQDKAIVFAEPGLYLKTFNLVALKDFIKYKPQVVNRVLRALIQAEEFTKKYPDQAIKIVSKALEISGSEIAGLWSDINIGVSLDQSLLLSLEDEARWAISNRLTDKTKVPNYLNFIHMNGLEKVKSEAVTVIH